MSLQIKDAVPNKSQTLLLLLLTLIISCTMNSSTKKLADYKWQNRIVFLIDDSMASEALKEQHELFKKKVKSMTDRDLILFITDGKGIVDSEGNRVSITVEELRITARIDPDFRGLVLLGKDGGYKLKKDFLVEPKEVFDLIDKMPMRHFEKTGKLRIK